MMMLQALMTAVLSGLFSGAILFALNERRDRSRLMLDKIEAAIESYTAWAEVLSRWPLAHHGMFLQGDRGEAKARVEEIWSDAREHHRRAKSLIHIYLPDATHVITDLYEILIPFVEESRKLKIASLSNEEMPEDAALKISEAGVSIVKESNRGLDTLIAAAQRQAHAPFLVRMPRKKAT